MHPLSSPFARQLLPIVAGACVLIFSSCSSDQLADRSSAQARISPPLAGQEVYFDGSIVAELKLGAGLRPTEGTPSGGRGRRGGGMGGGMGGGGRRGGRPGADESEGETGGGMRPAGLRPGGGGPPVMIHIQVTNNGPAPVVVSATDFNSPLGNFVVLPEKLTLEPGQSAEFEPMTSRLGGDFSEVKMDLTLNAAGRSEKRTVTLRVVPPVAAAPAKPGP